MPHSDILLNAFITLFVTIDPVGLAPIFLGVTAGFSRAERRSAASRATIIAFGLLALFLVAGQTILDTLGITIHAFRVAGGLLLFYTAFEMIYGSRQERKAEAGRAAMDHNKVANMAVFPLALPLIAGPGAISATILLASEQDSTLEWQLILLIIILAVLFMVWLSLMAAEAIDKYLGETGRMILTRLLGVLLAALAVQFVADGIFQLGRL